MPCFLLGTYIVCPCENESVKYIPVQLLKSGDCVYVGQGRIGTIQRIYRVPLQTSISCPLADDLVVSYHQVCRKMMNRVSRKSHPWRVAGELMRIGRAPESHGYLIVLSGGESIVRTREWECLTIGHGVADDPITADPYWSTPSPLYDLESFYITN